MVKYLELILLSYYLCLNKTIKHMKQLTNRIDPIAIAVIFYVVIFIINYLNF